MVEFVLFVGLILTFMGLFDSEEEKRLNAGIKADRRKEKQALKYKKYMESESNE